MMTPLILYYDMVKAALSMEIEEAINSGSRPIYTQARRFDYDVMRNKGIHLGHLDKLEESKRNAFLPRLLKVATGLAILFEPVLLDASLRFPYEVQFAEDPLAKLSSMDSTAKMEFFALLDDPQGRDFIDSRAQLEPRVGKQLFELLCEPDLNERKNGPWTSALPSGKPLFRHHANGVYRYLISGKPLKWVDDLGLHSAETIHPSNGRCFA